MVILKFAAMLKFQKRPLDLFEKCWFQTQHNGVLFSWHGNILQTGCFFGTWRNLKERLLWSTGDSIYGKQYMALIEVIKLIKQH